MFFKENHILTNLLQFCKGVNKLINKGTAADKAYTDVQKAFNVPHQKFLKNHRESSRSTFSFFTVEESNNWDPPGI